MPRRSIRSISRGGRRAKSKSLSGRAVAGTKARINGANDLQDRTELANSYALYDQGLRERLAGNFADAVDKLSRAYDIYDDYHGSVSVLNPILLFDLAQAAEESGDLALARDSYQKCLRLRPTFGEAALRLASLLARAGDNNLALVHARRFAEAAPNDPRAHVLMALILAKSGLLEDSRSEQEIARKLMDGSFTFAPKRQEGRSTDRGQWQPTDQLQCEPESDQRGEAQCLYAPKSVEGKQLPLSEPETKISPESAGSLDRKESNETQQVPAEKQDGGATPGK